jgi:hypothetical protein
MPHPLQPQPVIREQSAVRAEFLLHLGVRGEAAPTVQRPELSDEMTMFRFKANVFGAEICAFFVESHR